MKSRISEVSIGSRYSRLTVLALSEKRCWLRCLCDCGKEVDVHCVTLLNGNNKSCGCLKVDKFKARVTTHGMSKTRTYQVWSGMHKRCTNPNNKDFKHYGGRGITVCERWLRFESFLEDMGEAPARLTIDRINNSLGYFKDNCKWSTVKEQQNNRRASKVQVMIDFGGETKPISVIAKSLGMLPQTALKRFRRNPDPNYVFASFERKNRRASFAST